MWHTILMGVGSVNWEHWSDQATACITTSSSSCTLGSGHELNSQHMGIHSNTQWFWQSIFPSEISLLASPLTTFRSSQIKKRYQKHTESFSAVHIQSSINSSRDYVEIGINVDGGARLNDQGVTPGKIVLSTCTRAGLQHVAWKSKMP